MTGVGRFSAHLDKENDNFAIVSEKVNFMKRKKCLRTRTQK